MNTISINVFTGCNSGPAKNSSSRTGNMLAVWFGLVVLCLMASSVLRAQEYEPDVTAPAAAIAEPQYSSLTSTNDVIQGSRVPVFYNGKTYFVDMTLTLVPAVSTTGVVTMTVSAKTPLSPGLVVGTFKAGTYVSPSTVDGGTTYITVTGPSPLAGGGTAWTISTNSKSTGYTYPSSAAWYAESIASNPLATRIKAAGITSTAYSFGTGDSGSTWRSDSLLGFTQVGNTLTISDFTNCCGTDYSTPQDQITYTLVQ